MRVTSGSSFVHTALAVDCSQQLVGWIPSWARLPSSRWQQPVVKRFTWISLLLLGTAFGVRYALDELQFPRVIFPRKIPEFTVTARDPDRPSVKFAALGDVGSGTHEQVRVADAMAATAADAGLDCVLLLGDNFYTRADDTTTEALWRDRFEGIYPRLAEELDLAFVPFFMEGVGGVPDLNLPDGLHPTALGHERLADNVAPALRSALE